LWLGTVLLFIYLPILILLGTGLFGHSYNRRFGQLYSSKLYKAFYEHLELLDYDSRTLSLPLGCAVISTILGTLGAIGAFSIKKHAALL
jgi:spermidine/putrescine transport system permease protein